MCTLTHTHSCTESEALTLYGQVQEGVHQRLSAVARTAYELKVGSTRVQW